jgi:citrate synthase
MSGQQMEYQKGLDGVIAAESRICKINGEEGKLYYLGYPVDVLVENSDFEEVTYLLLNGELPTAAQLEDFRRRMREGRHLKQPILDMIGNFPKDSHPMELLQSVVSYLSGYVDHKIHHGPHCNCRDTLHQVSQIASVIAAFHRIREGLDYVPPRDDLSHGANFLYMLHGEEPEQREGEIMDRCLVLHAEHSFNASTFTARVVASTQSTCYSSISAAMGALYGSLHGGANEKVIAMVDRIGEVDRAEQFVRDKLDRKEKVMGMGHRVYRAKDPRSIIMEAYLEELSERKGDRRYLDILKTVERTFRNIMEEKGKPIYPNVDFFSGGVYRLLGIPSHLFTPIFAAARASGWLAHILEQREHEQRIFRPKALYVGDIDKVLQPVNLRG